MEFSFAIKHTSIFHSSAELSEVCIILGDILHPITYEIDEKQPCAAEKREKI